MSASKKWSPSVTITPIFCVKDSPVAVGSGEPLNCYGEEISLLNYKEHFSWLSSVGGGSSARNPCPNVNSSKSSTPGAGNRLSLFCRHDGQLAPCNGSLNTSDNMSEEPVDLRLANKKDSDPPREGFGYTDTRK